MRSETRTYRHHDGEIQKVQAVHLDNWEGLSFVFPEFSMEAFDQFCYIYEHFITASAPSLCGQMVLFTLPTDGDIPIPDYEHSYGSVKDPTVLASIILNEGVRIENKDPVFRTEEAEKLYHELEKNGCLKLVSGKRKYTRIIPVSHSAGFLSGTVPEDRVKANTSFFIMDFVDTATVFDTVGTPIGLMVKNGTVINPPLYGREAILVGKDGKTAVLPVKLNDLTVKIGGKTYQNDLFCRPRHKKTPINGKDDIVIIGNRVIAVRENGGSPVPSSGFVLKAENGHGIKPGDSVTYSGMEKYEFALQVGNSAITDGVPTKEFLSHFYNIRKLGSTSYPPSLYPLNYEKDRAARMLLGSDSDGKPILVWAEGAGKFGHEKGKESCGASLLEMADIASDLGLVNAVNLDGGGSAQILLGTQRALMLTDRDIDTGIELERAVPAGLIYTASER